MKFRVQIRNITTMREWWETYDKDIKAENIEAWCEATVRAFNNSLRPGEHPRVVLQYEILEDNNHEKHCWEKRSDGQSVMFRGRLCDLMYCSKCHVTGKRFGLSSTVVMDSKYRAKKYHKCGWQHKKD